MLCVCLEPCVLLGEDIMGAHRVHNDRGVLPRQLVPGVSFFGQAGDGFLERPYLIGWTAVCRPIRETV